MLSTTCHSDYKRLCCKTMCIVVVVVAVVVFSYNHRVLLCYNFSNAPVQSSLHYKLDYTDCTGTPYSHPVFPFGDQRRSDCLGTGVNSAANVCYN